jgi:hypothetical protein
MGYGATALGAYIGVALTIQLFMLMMRGSYVLSGKDEDLDLVELKARTFVGGSLKSFFNNGLWRERTERISVANYKAVSEVGAYDCIVSCLGSSAATKILKGVPKGDGARLLKKFHAAKGSVGHQIQRWDNKLDKLTLVAMNGWMDFRDEWLGSCGGRNGV